MMDKDKINYERIKVFFNIYIIIYTKGNQESRPTVSIPKDQNIKWKIPLPSSNKKKINLARRLVKEKPLTIRQPACP